MKQTATQFQMPGMLNVLNISPRRSFDTEPWAAFYCRLSQDDGLDGESNLSLIHILSDKRLQRW